MFDLDDTLYLEKEYCYSGFSAVAQYVSKARGVSRDDFYKCLCTLFPGAGGKLFNLALERFSISYGEDLIKELVAVYRGHKPAINMAAETVALLDYLKAHYKLAVITDGYLPAQRLKAESLGLERWFDCIVFTEELGRENWKPSPAAYELVAREKGAAHSECVYVADNPAKDFLAPNRLGWQTIMLERAGSVHSPVAPSAEHEPNIRICYLEQLKELL